MPPKDGRDIHDWDAPTVRSGMTSILFEERRNFGGDLGLGRTHHDVLSSLLPASRLVKHPQGFADPGGIAQEDFAARGVRIVLPPVTGAGVVRDQGGCSCRGRSFLFLRFQNRLSRRTEQIGSRPPALPVQGQIEGQHIHAGFSQETQIRDLRVRGDQSPHLLHGGCLAPWRPARPAPRPRQG